MLPTPFHRRKFLTGAVASLAVITASGLSASAGTYADKVVVKKGARQLLLMKNGKVLKTFRVSLGGSPKGHKTQEGDQKTPEGDYRLTSRNRHSKFHKSILISYPNAADRAQARKRGVSPGGQIRIHGSPNGAPTNMVAQAAMKLLTGLTAALR